ncbi:hypothetical protein ACOMHN_012176 [Nucella lapillus]
MAANVTKNQPNPFLSPMAGCWRSEAVPQTPGPDEALYRAAQAWLAPNSRHTPVSNIHSLAPHCHCSLSISLLLSFCQPLGGIPNNNHPKTIETCLKDFVQCYVASTPQLSCYVTPSLPPHTLLFFSLYVLSAERARGRVEVARE